MKCPLHNIQFTLKNILLKYIISSISTFQMLKWTFFSTCVVGYTQKEKFCHHFMSFHMHLYDFLPSVENKRRYFQKMSVFRESLWCFCPLYWKYILLCYKSYSFEMTWGRVNEDIMFILSEQGTQNTVPQKKQKKQPKAERPCKTNYTMPWELCCCFCLI